MACTDCYNNCPDKPLDTCVKYSGEDIPLLDICQGDPLSKLDAAIIDQLLAILGGNNITLSQVSLTNAPFLIALLGQKAPSLANIIQMLVDGEQSLKTLLDDLKVTPTSFDTLCLTGLPSNPSRDDILRAALVQICALKTLTGSISTTYVKLSDLPVLVTQINNTGTGNSSIPDYNQRMVPGIIYPYSGALSNFDSTGRGLSIVGFNKVFICNGSNGTQDWRGRSPIGAVRNVPGNSLDAAVDPNNVANSVFNINLGTGDKIGQSAVKLTANQNGSHTHAVGDPGHTHSLDTSLDGTSFGKVVVGNTGVDGPLSTKPAFTKITIGNSGNGDAHINIQPSIATLYITYIP